jgi:hypothetical protein
MSNILDTIQLSMLRDKLAENNIGRFHLTVTASGDTNGGGTLIEYSLSQYAYSADLVKGNDLFAVRCEFVRRHGWQERNDPILIPNLTKEERRELADAELSNEVPF